MSGVPHLPPEPRIVLQFDAVKRSVSLVEADLLIGWLRTMRGNRDAFALSTRIEQGAASAAARDVVIELSRDDLEALCATLADSDREPPPGYESVRALQRACERRDWSVGESDLGPKTPA